MGRSSSLGSEFRGAKLPARFGHARDKPFVRHVAEANAADAEATHITARTSAQIAAILNPRRKLRLRINADGFSNFA